MVEETDFSLVSASPTSVLFIYFRQLESRGADRVEETQEGNLWWDSIPGQQRQTHIIQEVVNLTTALTLGTLTILLEMLPYTGHLTNPTWKVKLLFNKCLTDIRISHLMLTQYH